MLTIKRLVKQHIIAKKKHEKIIDPIPADRLSNDN